ncbi:MAG TPA: hypothetical protein DIU15_20090, partial [Deltaproteobacteria bacterium]|nr:hypothetical protein [Deltaproteobacteria bacterium]
VPLSDGKCLNYVANDPPQPTDFAAQFLLVLLNPGTEETTFTMSLTEPEEVEARSMLVKPERI